VVDHDVAADVQRLAVARVDAPEVQRAARLGVDPDALAAHALERLVGELVDARARRAGGEAAQRPVEGGERLVEARLLLAQLVVPVAHGQPL
jgi:hypothetical protein